MSASSSQSFRASSSSKIISIPTRHDTKSGLRVILWKDIQWCFKDAQYVLCSNDVVLFLTNDGLDELFPPRIAHHPGVVLEVAVSDNNPKDSSTMKPSSSTLVFESNSSSNSDTLTDGDLSATARDVVALRITELDDDKQAFTTHPQIPASEQQLSLYSSSQHHHVYAHPSVTPPQGYPTLSFDESTNGGPGGSQSDIITAQQKQLHQLKEQAQQMQQKT
ncbi:MAG: hypothetical protein J3Q66DRAFT_392551 [Benniella sp.]|nr:MAG: hypothetical protein J3Q66DRAFT_392551 [Benniella sp.]